MLRFDRNMGAKNVYFRIIEVLAKIYQTAVYDHADVSIRADSYEQQKYGVLVEVSRYTEPESPILFYFIVVRTLQDLSRALTPTTKRAVYTWRCTSLERK